MKDPFPIQRGWKHILEQQWGKKIFVNSLSRYLTTRKEI